jgi:hypothetical protein
MKWARHVARIGAKRNAYRIRAVKPEGKIPLGKRKHRWVNNIKMYLGEIGLGGMGWIALAQETDQWRPIVNMVMNLRVRNMLGTS